MEHGMEPLWSVPPPGCDVVVVGGGLIGSSIALQLRWAGIDVCLMERSHLASGASGRNDGQIILETADYYPRMQQVYGPVVARGVLQFKRQGQLDLHQFLSSHTCPTLAYHRAGSLTLASSAHEESVLGEAVRAMEADGFTSQWLDRAQIEAVIGTSAFPCGKFDPLDAVVNPAELTRFFASQARSAGAVIVEDCPVTRVDRGMVHHAYGQTRCEIVLIATNAYAPQLLPELGRLIFPIRGQVQATAASEIRMSPIACITNFGYEYWHWTPEGRLVLGGKRPVDEHGETGWQERVNPAVQAALDEFRRQIYPQAADLPVERRWSGIMGFSADGLPLIGPLHGDPTLWVAAGFTGYGLGMCWSVAQAVAAVFRGEAGQWAEWLDPLKPNRFA